MNHRNWASFTERNASQRAAINRIAQRGACIHVITSGPKTDRVAYSLGVRDANVIRVMTVCHVYIISDDGRILARELR